MDKKYNVRSYLLLIANYIIALWESGNSQEAKRIIHISMKNELKYAKTRTIANKCIVKAFANISEKGLNEESRFDLIKAYIFNEFNWQLSECEFVSSFYNEIYDEDINHK